jgi:hypothetical protein
MLQGTCRDDGAGIKIHCGEKRYDMDAADPLVKVSCNSEEDWWVEDEDDVATWLDGVAIGIVVVPFIAGSTS